MVTDAARGVCGAGSIRNGRESVRLSQRSTAATAAGGFAAKRPVASRDRSTAAGAVLWAPALSSKRGYSVTLTADGGN